ncbi:MAG: SufS family cysteine desulfurase [Micrococcales bacterium]|nr:SufS family cysteine desulfurase [Micrococcales bacterium]
MRVDGDAQPAGLADQPADPLTGGEVEELRHLFPELSRSVRGGVRLIYLDSAATAQRVKTGLDAQHDFATSHNAAVHRATHAIAEEATLLYEAARAQTAAFFGVRDNEIIFTAGTTAAINLLAWSLNASSRVGQGDRIVVTQAEHHSNLVPWQRLAAMTGAELAYLPVGPDGRIDISGLDQIVTERTKVVAFGHASNVTGAVADVAPITAAAQAVGAFTVLDAAQTAPHQPVDLAALGVDFAAVSSHKMYGPMAIGALYGRYELLEALTPGAFGGSMVEIVTMREATFMPPPARFESGTPPVSAAIGWAAALKWLQSVGLDRIAARETELTRWLLDGLSLIDGIRVLGPTETSARIGVVSFEIAGVHPHDAGQYLDGEGVAVRVGHHCAQPLHRALGVTASTRASLGVYTTTEELDRCLEVLAQVRPYFGVA